MIDRIEVMQKKAAEKEEKGKTLVLSYGEGETVVMSL